MVSICSLRVIMKAILSECCRQLICTFSDSLKFTIVLAICSFLEKHKLTDEINVYLKS